MVTDFGTGDGFESTDSKDYEDSENFGDGRRESVTWSFENVD